MVALHANCHFLMHFKILAILLLKGAEKMKTEYDISTKEKEMSYLLLVDFILYSKLGFRPANSGSRYLKEIIIYIFEKETEDYSIESEIKEYIKKKKINKNYKTIKSKIIYSINNVKKDIIKKNFQEVFRVEYDVYYLSTKNIIELMINLLENKYR